MVFKIVTSILLICFAISNSFAQKVTTETSGYKYQDSTYSKMEIGRILAQHSEAKSYYDTFVTKKQHAKDGYIAGAILLTIGGGLALNEIKDCQGGPCLVNIMLGVGVVFIGVVVELFAITNQAKANKNLNRALDVFNEDQILGNTQDYKLNLSAIDNGLGLTLSF